MEEKESLLKTIEEVNDDKTVMQEWILEENARLKYEGQMSYAREEGLKEGIEQGIEKGIEQGIEKGIEQGIEKGIEQGIEKGIEQGIEKGIEQGNISKELELITNMLNENTNYEFISKITGKTMKEIEEIARNMD